MINYCETCGFADLRQNGCRLLKIRIDPTKDFCSKHSENSIFCEYCNKPLVTKLHVIPTKSVNHVLCPECSSLINTCQFCKSGNKCDFETNPSNIPKIINQKTRQGNMVMTTQVRNPARVDITCKAGCKCYSEEYGCCKEFNNCERIESIYD